MVYRIHCRYDRVRHLHKHGASNSGEHTYGAVSAFDIPNVCLNCCVGILVVIGFRQKPVNKKAIRDSNSLTGASHYLPNR